MRSKRIIITALLCVAAVGGTASADHGEGAISGTVTDAAAAPIGGICVGAYQVDDWEEDYFLVTETSTAADGTYSFPFLAPGDFRIRFANCDDEGSYLPEWYDNEGSIWDADDVRVVEYQTTTVNASLSTGGSISGTITTVDGVVPDCLYVAAYSLDDGYEGEFLGATETGAYRIDGLRPGSYKVRFDACNDVVVVEPRGMRPMSHDEASPYAFEWYSDAITFEAGQSVAVAEGVDTPGIDAELEHGGTVGGTITFPPDTDAEVCISVFAEDGGYVTSTYVWNSADYRVFNLKQGSYKFEFSCGVFQTEWYNDKPTFSQADSIPVVEDGTTAGIDATLVARPVADLAVTAIRIKNVPIQTDEGTLVHSGWMRSIEVDIANLGDRAAQGGVNIDMVAHSQGYEHIGSDSVALRPGAATTVTMPWDGLGTVGDVTVEASVCSEDEDRFYRNNSLRDSHYVIAGGTGMGFTMSRSYGDCYDY